MSKSISEIFIKEAIRTEAPITAELINRITEERTIRLLHASIGLATEAGELLDALKKFIFYGKDLDIVNIKEEGGDSQWYFALLLDELGYSYEEIWALVIKKLQARYEGKFNKEGAINRDLINERNILESEIPLNIGGHKVIAKVSRELNEKGDYDIKIKSIEDLTKKIVDKVKMEIVDDEDDYMNSEGGIKDKEND